MDEYLIWSNEHRGWWGPNRCGYTGLVGAGIYTRQDAIDICRDSIPSAMHCGVIAEIPVRRADLQEFMTGQMIPSQVMRR